MGGCHAITGMITKVVDSKYGHRSYSRCNVGWRNILNEVWYVINLVRYLYIELCEEEFTD